MRNARTHWWLIAGFSTVLALVVLMMALSLNQMARIQDNLKHIVYSQNVKSELAFTMRLTARERTLSLYKMVMMSDPFARDDEFMLFNRWGARFAEARQQLQQMNLTPREQEVLREQSELVSVAVPMQDEVVSLMVRDKTESAIHLLLTEAIPAQDRVLAKLDIMAEEQRLASKLAAAEAEAAYNDTRGLTALFGGLIVLFGGVIAWGSIRGTRRAEARLFFEMEKAQVTLSSIGEAVITVDAAGKVEYLNDMASQLTGWSPDEARGRSLVDVVALTDSTLIDGIASVLREVLYTRAVVTSAGRDVAMLARAGGRYDIEYSLAPILVADGASLGAVLVLRNVTEVRAMARAMEYQARYDMLTGLINRYEFEHQIESALASAAKGGVVHTLCFIDLDQFKVVNDTCGHVAGDELLKQVAQAIKEHVRATDVLARLGGDEFGLLLQGCPLERAKHIAEQILDELRAWRFVWEEHAFEVGASIGLVAMDAAAGTMAQVMSAADSACYVAKDLGRNRWHAYQPDDKEMAKRLGEMQWTGRITAALEQDLFVLYGQRIEPLTPGRRHCEILVRMIGNDNEIIPPGAFIPAAERYGMMARIDRWVVSRLFDTLKANPGRDGDLVWMVNLSGQSLCEADFLAFVVDQVKSAGLPRGSVGFEITETAAIANLSHALQFVAALRELGCPIALDDFGSGLSSFGYLKNLHIDYLKIDGSFVRNIVDNPLDAAMVASINGIGHTMGLKTIAEFVENNAIRDKLEAIGVDYAQGYGVAKPVPLRDVLVACG